MRFKRATSLRAFRRRSRFAGLGEGVGRRRRRKAKHRKRSLWSKVIALGEHLQIRARRGHRAAWLELQPGLYLVAELREEGLRDELGRSVTPRQVTSELLRVTDYALDQIFPKRRQQQARALPAPQQQQPQQQQPQQQPQQQQPQQQPQQQQQRALPAPQPPQAEVVQQYAVHQNTVPQDKPLPPQAARWLQHTASISHGEDER